MVKNRMISLEKMKDRHLKEIGEGMVDIERHEDDRIRIEEHFSKEISTLESKQRVEFEFNAERLLSDAARGHLNKVDLSELEQAVNWDESVNEQHESFTVNLGNQLKITQNLRLVRCNILGQCSSPINYRL